MIAFLRTTEDINTKRWWILLAVLLLHFPNTGKCQTNYYGKWKTAKSCLLVTSNPEDKETLRRICEGSIVNIGKHTIKFTPKDVCLLENIDNFNIVSSQQLSHKQIEDKYNERVAYALYHDVKVQNEIEELVTDFVAENSGTEPLTIFIINKQVIAIYFEPVLLILKKVKY